MQFGPECMNYEWGKNLKSLYFSTQDIGEIDSYLNSASTVKNCTLLSNVYKCWMRFSGFDS